MMSNNLRLYGTILIVIEFLIVAMGVRFVQLLAPVMFFYTTYFFCNKLDFLDGKLDVDKFRKLYFISNFKFFIILFVI